MVRRSVQLTARLLGWTLASLAVLGALVVWLLAMGPVSLDVLTPHLERALSSHAGGVATTIERTELRVHRRVGVALVALGVVTRNADGKVLFDVPEVEVGISMDALLRHQILAPSRLRARSPSVTLVRQEDGGFGLRDRPDDGAGPTEALDLELLAGMLLSEPHPDQPLSYLELIGIDGAAIDLEDETSGTRIDASGGTLSVVREGPALAARAVIEIARGPRTLGATALLRIDPEREEIAGLLDLERARPVDLRLAQDLAPAWLRTALERIPLETFELNVATRVRARTDFAGALQELTFRVAGDRGQVAWAGELERPLEVGRLRLSGAFNPTGERLTVDRLEILANGATVDATGELRLTPDGPAIQANATARNVAIEALGALWPLRAADEARAWVTENITAGRAPEGEVMVDIRPGDLDRKPLREAAVAGSFTFEDLTVRYFEHLPAVTSVDGTATFDGQAMRFAAGGGRLGALAADDASITVTGIGIKGRDTTQLEVETTITGPLRDALALIDLPPFGFASDLGLDPQAARGDARTLLRVGLPLHRDVSDEEVRIEAEAALSEVGIDRLFDVVDLADGTFELAVDRGAMMLNGRALVAGRPIDVEWEEAFSDRSFDRRVMVEGSIDPEALRTLGAPELPIEFEGAADTRLRILESAGRLEVDADLDLATARLAYPPLEWRKPLGEVAWLEARLRIADGSALVERFDFDSDTLRASAGARVRLDPLQLDEVQIRRFEHAGQAFEGQILRTPDDRLAINVDARRLDLRPFLGDEDEEAEATAGPDIADWPPVRLEVNAREVTLNDDGQLLDVVGSAERDGRGWRAADLDARLPNERSVRLSLRDGEPRTLVLTSDDAGELFRTFDRTRRVEGGRLLLEATIEADEPALVASGRLTVNAFMLRDAPVLARLLTLASPTGIGNVLQGEGIFVDRLELPFILDGDMLMLEDARMTGSQLGLTAAGRLNLETERLDLNGTVVPIYGINRAIGAIPLIGDFLAGSDGEGAFAASYRVRGPFEDPSVSVNPLSAITPGFLRELFAGLRDGTLEPPEMLEERN